MDSQNKGSLRSRADINPRSHPYTSPVDSLVHSKCSIKFDELNSGVRNSSKGKWKKDRIHDCVCTMEISFSKPKLRHVVYKPNYTYDKIFGLASALDPPPHVSFLLPSLQSPICCIRSPFTGSRHY